MIDQNDVVARLDPSIEIKQVFKTDPRRFVYRVEKQGAIYVLKGSPAYKRGSIQDVRNEKDCLERLDGIKGVPQLQHFYSNSSYVAVLKDYTDGTLLSNAGNVIPNAFWASLEDLTERIHARGVSRLDIKGDNVFLCRGPTAALFDFDIAHPDASPAFVDSDKKYFQRLRDRYLRAA